VLNRAGYASPIRTPRGRDILAACGQLKSESEKKRASVIRRESRDAEAASNQDTPTDVSLPFAFMTAGMND